MTTSTENTEITTHVLAIWLAEQTWSDFAQSLATFYADRGYLTEKQEASARSMYAKVTAKAAAKASAPAAPKSEPLAADGIYAKDGEVFKVQWNQNHTNLYAKRLVENPEAKTYSWEYVGKGPLYTLTEADRLTAEKAKELGQLYGVCIFCGRTLTDEASIEAGYGPVCAENHGLPWGHVTPIDGETLMG